MEKMLLSKTAIVTGSTRGIGKAIASGLGREGCNVIITSRSQQDCSRVVQELSSQGIECSSITCDLSKITDIEKLIDKTAERYGGIDILVNNAGMAITKTVENITEEDWDSVVDLNLRSVFFVSQKAGKFMMQNGQGKIINISSVFGLVAEKQVLPYCVAKAGLLQMTKALALEWASRGILVNAVCPGYVMTDMNREQRSNEKSASHLLRKIPLGRFADKEEIVGAVIFLASKHSDYMTGQTIVIDGGWTTQ